MIEPAIGRDRRLACADAGSDRSDEDIGAAELEIDTRLALLHAANHLRAEHRLKPPRHCLGIGSAQMNMVPSDIICLLCQGVFSPVTAHYEHHFDGTASAAQSASAAPAFCRARVGRASRLRRG